MGMCARRLPRFRTRAPGFFRSGVRPQQLAKAIRKGEIGFCGAFFNLKTGRVSSIAADPATWAQMGVQRISNPAEDERLAA
jgi:hypothetical protein